MPPSGLVVAAFALFCALMAAIGSPGEARAAGAGAAMAAEAIGVGAKGMSPFFHLQQPASMTATPRIQLPTKPADAAATGTAAAAAARTGTPTPQGTANASPGGSGTAVSPGDPGAGAAGQGAAGQVAPAEGLPGGGELSPGQLEPGARVGTGTGTGDNGGAGGAEPGAAAMAEAEAARRRFGSGGVESGVIAGPRGIVAVPVPAPEVVRRWTESGSPWGEEETALSRLVDGRPWPLNWWPLYVLLAVSAAVGFAWVWRRVEDAAG